MAAINQRRVLLGAFAGFVVWAIWSLVVNVAILGPLYPAAQDAGLLLREPRVPFFIGVWFLILFFLSEMIALLYAWVRATLGPGWRTAATVGVFVGFAAGVPTNLATASWSPLDRVFTVWWTLDLLAGAILAALVAGWLYRD
ncbi:MAG: hypothetical protein ACE5MH_02325 [Terriglobia bacterium]